MPWRWLATTPASLDRPSMSTFIASDALRVRMLNRATTARAPALAFPPVGRGPLEPTRAFGDIGAECRAYFFLFWSRAVVEWSLA